MRFKAGGRTTTCALINQNLNPGFVPDLNKSALHHCSNIISDNLVIRKDLAAGSLTTPATSRKCLRSCCYTGTHIPSNAGIPYYDSIP